MAVNMTATKVPLKPQANGARNQQSGRAPNPRPQFAEFEGRPIEVGQDVFYYAMCQRRSPAMAVVTEVQELDDGSYGRMVSVRVESADGPIDHDSVLHIDDPMCIDPRKRENGAWDYRPDPTYITQLKQEFEQRLARAERRIEVLEEGLGVVNEKTAKARGKARAKSDEAETDEQN